MTYVRPTPVADTAPPQPTSETWAETVRGCSILCHPDEPCWLTEDGVCLAMMDFTEERAGIREYDGLQSRAQAEAGAVGDYQRWRRDANR